MFGEVALNLIRLMGRQDTMPSAMYPEDIPAAVTRLRSALEREELPGQSADAADYDEEEKVSIQTRAMPLVELLVAAEKEQVPVMWEEGARKY
jgi:hypothetical protein